MVKLVKLGLAPGKKSGKMVWIPKKKGRKFKKGGGPDVKLSTPPGAPLLAFVSN